MILRIQGRRALAAATASSTQSVSSLAAEPTNSGSLDPIYRVNNTEGTFASLFPFSVGLNGVDQETNYLAINLMLVLLLTALFVTLLLRWTKMAHSYARQLAVMSNPEHQTFWRNNQNQWWPWFKKHLIYAPIWKKRHNREIALSSAIDVGTLPGRSQALLLTIYIVFTIAWTMTLPYDRSPAEVIAALRGRSGLIAIFNLFPTVVFALRNNPFIWLLHVSYDTFQLFHRWAARIFIVQILLHAAAWLGNTHRSGGWSAVRYGLSSGPHAASYAWGTAGAAAGLIILFQSWSPIRHAFYEIFLAVHKILIFVVLLGTLLHLKLDNLPQSFWIIIIYVIWCYEYIMRIGRIIRYNCSRTQASSKVIITALPGDACRVTFHLPGYWRPTPGTHVHAYIPKFGFMQSHPFSVAWSEVFDMNDEYSKSPVTSFDIDDEKPIDYEPKYRSTVSLICRARTGFTRNMFEKVRLMEGGMCETFGYIEGFYGGHDNLASYGDVILFAGGVGITHQIMFCKQLVEGFNAGTVACQRVTLVWTIRSSEYLEWVKPYMNDILNMPNRRILVDIKIYNTDKKSPPKSEIMSKSRKVVMYPGRPPAEQIIGEVIRTRKGAIAVTVCGPGAFADDVRNAVRWRTHQGVIDFNEEAFTY